MSQQTLETWEMKAKRLAQETKAAARAMDPLKSTPKQRARYKSARYAMYLHMDEVPDD